MGPPEAYCFVESYSRSQRTTLLSFGFLILRVYFHLLNEQRRYKITQDNGKQIGMNDQSSLRDKQLLKSLSLLFGTEREIARNESLDPGSLGTNQEKQFFWISQESGSGQRQ
jgi:hypothetical protein